jgi:hypothetical protein
MDVHGSLGGEGGQEGGCMGGGGGGKCSELYQSWAWYNIHFII